MTSWFHQGACFSKHYYLLTVQVVLRNPVKKYISYTWILIVSGKELVKDDPFPWDQLRNCVGVRFYAADKHLPLRMIVIPFSFPFPTLLCLFKAFRLYLCTLICKEFSPCNLRMPRIPRVQSFLLLKKQNSSHFHFYNLRLPDSVPDTTLPFLFPAWGGGAQCVHRFLTIIRSPFIHSIEFRSLEKSDNAEWTIYKVNISTFLLYFFTTLPKSIPSAYQLVPS